MKNNLYKIVMILFATFTMASCDLDLQKNYDYKGSVLDPHIDMTAMEFFESRPDLFSELVEAINYTGMNEYYTQTKEMCTYLALDNTAMQEFRENEFPGIQKITECNRDIVKNMLLYHIIEGEYSSYGELQVEAKFVLTKLEGEKGLMTMSVWKNPWQAAVGKIIINATGSNGKAPQRQARTSNIMPRNGVIHIFERYCYYQRYNN